MKQGRVEISEQQALYFRARRGHLAGPGAMDVVTAARDLLGAQAQLLGPALLALSQRTAGRPTAAELERRLLEAPRGLVRTWGQRDTLHIYDATDWSATVAARPAWIQTGRKGPAPTEEDLLEAADRIAAAGAPVTRADLMPHAPPAFVEALEELAAQSKMDPVRLAAGRLLWLLARRGVVCVAGRVGAEQAYAHRPLWYPELAWPRELPAARPAATALARRYLALYGPATATDTAHFTGAKVTTAREWLQDLDDELVPVTCGGRHGLVALAADADELQTPAPAGARDWPLRLLPAFDTMMMGHADKGWTVPDEGDRKRIWRTAAQVAAGVLWRGRVVAVWTHKVRRKALEIELEPLSGWRKGKHLGGVRREAKAVARHLAVRAGEVRITGRRG